MVPPTAETHEQMSILESLHFFNTRLLPEVAPAHAPFQRTLIAAMQWLSAPRVIQLSLLILTKAIQNSRSSAAPFFDKELLHFRGICLAELMALASDAHAECSAMALDSIQLVMLAEMQLEPVGPWAYHLEATRGLINLQGGMASLFYKKPAVRYLLINYMGIDILTTTTCRVNLLEAQNVGLQSSYISLLARREEETITTASFCPLQLLQSIVDINKLRIRRSHLADSLAESSARLQEFARIEQAVSAFNPSSWAIRMLDWGSILPRPTRSSPSDEDITAMTILAQTHQSATLLYLHLSCPLSSILQPAAFVLATHRTLTANLATLLSQSSLDTEGPIHTQLHKFAIWPLLVAAYASVGWDFRVDEEACEQDLERVRQAARIIGSRPLMVATQVLEDVRHRRAMNGGGEWAWDDGFGARCSFCVL